MGAHEEQTLDSLTCNDFLCSCPGERSCPCQRAAVRNLPDDTDHVDCVSARSRDRILAFCTYAQAAAAEGDLGNVCGQYYFYPRGYGNNWRLDRYRAHADGSSETPCPLLPRVMAGGVRCGEGDAEVNCRAIHMARHIGDERTLVLGSRVSNRYRPVESEGTRRANDPAVALFGVVDLQRALRRANCDQGICREE